ncbi:peptidoglycan DD-metalloendopeptidase family protein [Sphingomonas sp.]|uniref:peptidoglycan DD-metalloendopeptidase family protein n=1 Tax=Sphingomonas sp. TaxID=28214 RepID=UPI003B3A711D
MRGAAALLSIGLIAAAPASEKRATQPSTTKFVPRKLFDEPSPRPALADPTPAGGQKAVWDVARVTPDAVEIPKSTYVVQPGDTLLAIVRKTGGSANVIAHDNDLDPPFRLRPGQKLKIAGGRYHVVRKGQSGIAIARAYGVEWLRIVDLNHLEEPYMLREGERLLLPATKEVAKMTLEQRAAAFKIDLTDIATGSEPALAPQAKPAAPTPSPARTLSPTTAVADPVVDFGGRFAWPVQGKVIRRYGPMENGGRSDGIAIAAPFGRPIGAAADGVVIWVGQHPAFGNVVLLRHGNGWVTIYGNADKLLVKRGQSVKIGQPIAQVGLSGTSVYQPQTFFEVLRGRKPVNPMSLLPKQRTDGSAARSDQSEANPDANDR